jgi:hypothetical protein
MCSSEHKKGKQVGEEVKGVGVMKDEEIKVEKKSLTGQETMRESS